MPKELLRSIPNRETRQRNQEVADFYFDAEITRQTADTFINFLRSQNQQNPKRELTLHLNSNGGGIEPVMDMVKQMGHFDNPISTICETRAMSAGVLLLASGDKGKRYAYEDAKIMLHQISTVPPNSRMQVEELFDFTRAAMKINREYFRELADRTKTTPQEYIEMTHKKDLYVSAEKARQLGIIDEVILKPKKKNHVQT